MEIILNVGIPHIEGMPVITVRIGFPSMVQDEIGSMRLRYPYTVHWNENGQVRMFDAQDTEEYIYTPFGKVDAESVFKTLSSFMDHCAETHNMEFHRMDGSCSDQFHNMSESIADYVQMYVIENYPDESDIDDESEMEWHSGL